MIARSFAQHPKVLILNDPARGIDISTNKIEYDGTLNDLYENDLEKFVEYNIHDVRIVKKLDDKLDFIDIARGNEVNMTIAWKSLIDRPILWQGKQ